MNIRSIFTFSEPLEHDTIRLDGTQKSIIYDIRREKPDTPPPRVSARIDDNLDYMKARYTYPLNSDIVVREVRLVSGTRCFLMFADGLVDTNAIDSAVLEPLESVTIDGGSLEECIEKSLIWHNQVKIVRELDTICNDINFGCAAVFADGLDAAFSLDVRKWEHRSVSKPENEQTIYGPQEGFTELLRTNTALIRKTLKTERLIMKSFECGTVGKTPGVIMYIEGTANGALVEEAQRRIDGADAEFILTVEELAIMITESPYFQLLRTERPDRTARALADGRVAIMMSGSPNAVILPTNAAELTHSAEDAYLKTPYAVMTRIVRLFAMIFSVLLPAVYIAVTLYHQEIIPTELIYSISASRENVPFPSVFEILLMELAFELIREAGIRMPGAVGSALSIVGGLILGQAAVTAKIVSPIMIIVIAITGIGSFATSDYSLAWTFRIMRLFLLVLASVLGFFGIAAGMYVILMYAASCESFGVPFLSPVSDENGGSIYSSVLVRPLWKKRMRPQFLKSKKPFFEPKVSRRWFVKEK